MVYFLCTLFVGGLMFLWSFVGLFERKRKRDPSVSWVFLKDVVNTGILRSLSEPGFIKEIVHQEFWDPSVSRVCERDRAHRNLEIPQWAGFCERYRGHRTFGVYLAWAGSDVPPWYMTTTSTSSLFSITTFKMSKMFLSIVLCTGKFLLFSFYLWCLAGRSTAISCNCR